MTSNPPPARDGWLLLRSRLRPLAFVWLTALVIEGVLYYLLADALSQPDLFRSPALLVLGGAVFASWRVVRHRHGHEERRHGDRRHASRREDEAEPTDERPDAR